MIFTELVILIFAISLLFYVVFGGADFGAGIVEIFTGDRGVSTISRAIAPVWEANHIWLIIAVVILFNGFPVVYSTITTALHIPVLLALLGIIFRGTAFTFRHYDAVKDGSQRLYNQVFRYSSLFSTFFLGVILGALLAGTIPNYNDYYEVGESMNFYTLFMKPWLNPFCILCGLFVSVLSAYIASIFLLGEVETDFGYQLIARFIKRLFLASMLAGGLLMASAYYQDLDFFHRFFDHSLSVATGIIATIIVPLIWIYIQRKQVWNLRILVGVQVVLIVLGWLAIQWPNVLHFNDGQTISIYEAAASKPVMVVLFYSLLIGVVIIFPALYYLLKVFKGNSKTS
ncbi:cytochrome d ubiquinol oxidase subunit II [Membranihabitans marinus]|uniref:cytochrome d ubiquinol oxidase subunit II n=1 Tax=Membranihabitans marinus TaxID=1227546 RepID=UPI001F18B288|nr:cytochrome d ubiquinol oxidase subunit II [Membranihabitans marinus]